MKKLYERKGLNLVIPLLRRKDFPRISFDTDILHRERSKSKKQNAPEVFRRITRVPNPSARASQRF